MAFKMHTHVTDLGQIFSYYSKSTQGMLDTLDTLIVSAVGVLSWLDKCTSSTV